MNLSGFNAAEVDTTDEFAPLPKGEYTAICTNSEEKATKAGTGSYLEMKWQIIEGQFQNRILFSRLNLKNPNPVAVKIAEKDLASICKATGVLSPNSSAELHNKPVVLKVVVRQREGYDPSNDIKGYKSVGGATQAAAPVAPAAVAQQQAGGAEAFWQR